MEFFKGRQHLNIVVKGWNAIKEGQEVTVACYNQ